MMNENLYVKWIFVMFSMLSVVVICRGCIWPGRRFVFAIRHVGVYMETSSCMLQKFHNVKYDFVSLKANVGGAQEKPNLSKL